MHMADALISPAVGAALWTAAASATLYSVRKTGREFPEQKVPLMGVLGAFVFAAQMINFAIPGTGSSGHLGGGLLLAVLLGPHAGFLTMASILAVQALLFADGGLLALGCNIVNLALFPCWVAYPLVYRTVAGRQPSRTRLAAAVTLAVVTGLQLGALGVVAGTVLSGITELPLRTFALFMLPIHLAIGLVEAAVTCAVLWYVRQEAPELCAPAAPACPESGAGAGPRRRLLAAVVLAAVLTAGVFSWFASPGPDGLEWSVQRTTGRESLENDGPVHALAAVWQQRSALLADYRLKWTAAGDEKAPAREEKPAWPVVSEGTSAAGLIGSALTLLLTAAVGFGCRALSRRG